MMGFAVWLTTAFACLANAQTRAVHPQEHVLISYLAIGLVTLFLMTPKNGLHALGKYAQFHRASAEKNFRRGAPAALKKS
jgi:hypothetical protein